MKAVKDFVNPLLKRREIEFVVEADSNPGFEEIRKKVASHAKADESLVAVKKLRGTFGSREFFISAFVYHDTASKEATEPKVKVKKTPGVAS